MTTQNRARTRAVRADMATTGENYTRAAARPSSSPSLRDTASLTAKQIGRITAREFELLGRDLLVLCRGGSDLQDSYEWLDYWRKGWPGGGWVLEWMSGPYADEMHDFLVRWAADVETSTWLPRDVRLDDRHIDHNSRERYWLLVGGVPFELRSIEPIGLEQAAERLRHRLHSARDGS